MGLKRQVSKAVKAKRNAKTIAVNEDEEEQDALAIGTDVNQVADLVECMAHAGASGQNFVCLPLFNPRLRRYQQTEGSGGDSCLGRSELLLDHEDWVAHVIGKMSPWIDLDSSNAACRKGSDQALYQEYSYANHLGLQAVLLAPPTHSRQFGAQAVRSIKSLLAKFPATGPQMWIHLRMDDPLETWRSWDLVRHHADHERKLGVVLEIVDGHIPVLSDPMVSIWKAEAVKAVVLSTDIFQRVGEGKGGTVKLAAPLRQLVQWFTAQQVHIILKGAVAQAQDDSIRSYVRYIEKLHRRAPMPALSPAQTLQKQFNSRYRNVLQSPLDPLCVNLDSHTYQMMEADPVKYSLYADALYAAMKDRIQDTTSQTLRVLVVGPGRGPLIAATLQRFKQLKAETKGSYKLRLRLTAVEKNANAVLTLRNRFTANSQVTIVQGDMRIILGTAHLPSNPAIVDLMAAKADIIVSELLGSWGDNEASPECLDAIQHVLRDDGVMIPQSYCSFAAPIASSRLWGDAREMFWGAKGAATLREGLDCPYVVQMESFSPLSAELPVFQVRPLMV